MTKTTSSIEKYGDHSLSVSISMTCMWAVPRQRSTSASAAGATWLSQDDRIRHPGGTIDD